MRGMNHKLYHVAVLLSTEQCLHLSSQALKGLVDEATFYDKQVINVINFARQIAPLANCCAKELLLQGWRCEGLGEALAAPQPSHTTPFHIVQMPESHSTMCRNNNDHFLMNESEREHPLDCSSTNGLL